MKKYCLNEYEHHYWKNDQLVVGLDEAGRGPIAGPLVVAGVIFPKDYENLEIYDSKALSEKKREAMYQQIISDALVYEIKIIDEKTIDELNIYRATQKAMEDIVAKLGCEIVLTDAMPLTIPVHYEAIVKGDQKSISIAAASILAKVTRDKIMKDYALIYPEYGFEKHKGYPTKAHLEALEKYGALKIHRKSYGPLKKLNQLHLDL